MHIEAFEVGFTQFEKEASRGQKYTGQDFSDLFTAFLNM